MRSRAVWVQAERFFCELLCFIDRRDIEVQQTPPTPLQQTPNINSLTADNLTLEQFDLCLNRRSNCPSDLVLNIKNICEFTVVSFSPNVMASARVYEL